MRMRLLVTGLLSSLALEAAAGELSGRVTSDRRGVVGATVSAAPYESAYAVARRETRGESAPAALATATTTADGKFRLTVPPNAPPFVVRVTFGGLASRTVDGVFEGADRDDIGEIALRSGETIAGRVVDGGGKPVSGATVRLGRDGAFATTRADGLFRFDDVEAPQVFGGPFGPAARSGSPRLSLSAPGFELQTSTPKLSGAPTTVTLRPSTAKLSGLLRDASGRPAIDAVVRVTGEATSRWVLTDAAGRFEIPGVAARQARLEALGRDGSSLETAISGPGSGGSFTLAKPGTLEGRITQSDNGRFVVGVRVALRAGAFSAVGRTGLDGRYRFTGVPRGAYRVTFDEPRFVLAERRDVSVDAGETKTLDVALNPAVALVGRVTDESGKPVAGAMGTVSSGAESRMGLMLRLGGRAGDDARGFISGPDGTFRASRLSPGTNQRLMVTHPDYERRIVPGIDLVPGSPKPLSVDVVLSPGVTITGTVKDKEGRPVMGAGVGLSRSIRLQGGRGGNSFQIATVESPRPQLETDEEGRFTFKGLTAGEYDVNVTKTGFTRHTTQALKAAEGMAALEITLMPGASVGGRVTQPNGAPVSGYTVAALPAGTERLMMGGRGGFAAVTDTDGAFTIEGLTPGTTYDLEARAAGDFRGGQRKRDVVAPASDIVIEVPARGRIAGRVIDAATNAPITEFEARYSPSMGGGGMVVVVRGGPGEGDRRTPFSSSEGAFVFEDVPPGNWDVTVWAKTYQEARTSAVAVAAGETKTIEVKASRGLAIRGRVVDAKSGRGIPEASVSVRPNVAGGSMFVFDAGGPGGELTDAEGRFEVTGQAPGAYQVTATHPLFSEGTARLTLEDRDGAIDVPLVQGGTIAGLVLSAQGAPLAGAEVTLQNGSDGGGLRFGFDGQSALTDGAGRFRFEHLAAGRYRLSASLRAESSTPIDVALNAGDVREDVRVTLDAGAVVKGVVSGVSESERGALMVMAQGAQDYFASARTAADGTFEFSGVPAGTLTLRATAGDLVFGSSRTAVKELVVPEGRAEIATEIVFQDGLSISGTVTRKGVPVAGARVSAFMTGSGRQASARVDESGAFRITGLEKGRVNLVAFAESFESQVSQVVELQADQTVDLVIPTARLSGVVVDAASGLPLESTVEMQRANPSPQNPGGRMIMTTDSSGRFAFDDLDPVDFRLTARRTNYEAVTRTVRPTEAGEEVRFELKRGAGLALEAKDAQMGFGLRSIFVRVQEGTHDAFFGPVTLDGEGRGEIPGLPPGSYSLTAQAAGYAPIRIPNVMAPSGGLRLPFTPGGTVEFRSTEEFLADGSRTGQLISLTGLPIGFGPNGPGSFRLSRLTQRVENLAPGRYRLTLDGGVSKDFEVTEGGVTIVALP